MTIAACYVTPEGVVFGADSTASVLFAGTGKTDGYHYFNHTQKIFEIGKDSTFGLVTWGLGGLGEFSHRTLAALLADEIAANPPPNTVEEVALRWSALFWARYSTALAPVIARTAELRAKPAYDGAVNPAPAGARTKDEEDEYRNLNRNLVVGFCLGGYCPKTRLPAAFEVIFQPSDVAAPVPRSVAGWSFWGAPNMIERLMFGRDSGLRQAVLDSKKWQGTPAELDTILVEFSLDTGALPMRDAIDFVHSCIYSTIKAMKFSSLPQICGGPIELAVITSDRNFRWVQHKAWDAAIFNGE